RTSAAKAGTAARRLAAARVANAVRFIPGLHMTTPHRTARRPDERKRPLTRLVYDCRHTSCLDRPAHPDRTENDGDRQVSWLADQGRCASPSQQSFRPWPSGPPVAYDARASRLQLREQPEFHTPFPFNPLSGNLTRPWQ